MLLAHLTGLPHHPEEWSLLQLLPASLAWLIAAVVVFFSRK